MLRPVTPAARISAAIEILDSIRSGAAAEQVLTHWARANRYAGSGDRAAIRDHVFDALRCRRSFAWLGGSESGRGLMIGALRAGGIATETHFTGERFAPDPLTAGETAGPQLGDAPRAVQLDCPDWLLPHFESSLGPETEAVLAVLRHRAPVYLRVNRRKTTPEAAMAELAEAGVNSRSHSLSPTALKVTGNPRRVQSSPAYREGRVELQDVASQAIIDALPLVPGMTVLDFCAGGGGKSLAIAALEEVRITAHDIVPDRMLDLPARASRAGIDVTLAEDKSELRPGYDLVLCDAPCSGSGAWRRSPEAKWLLTEARLEELCAIQSGILEEAAALVAPRGYLAYATCSLLTAENRDRIGKFLTAHRDWSVLRERRLTPLDGGDGFYIAVLTRK